MSFPFYGLVVGIFVVGCVKESRGTCDVGFWGDDCKRKCAEGCYFGYDCDEDNGVCSRCIDGFYGPHCDSKCPEKCVRCNQETGVCTSCENSLYGDFCTKPCNSSCLGCHTSSGQCYSCKGGYWGTYCENECVSEDECLFKCDTGSNSSVCQYACRCVRCNRNNGRCYQCAAGFWGRGCYKRCPQNCSHCDFDVGRCYSCDNGYWGNQCQNKCPEQCTTCNSGRQCSGCKNGNWGSSCEYRCSQCESCNYYYGYCTKCRHGYWGSSCTSICPDGCKCCNMSNGECIENDCQTKNAIKSEGTGTEPEQFTTVIITGVTMIGVGFVLSVICVTLALVILRRMKNSQQNGGKNMYEGSQHQTGFQNDLELYENPSY